MFNIKTFSIILISSLLIFTSCSKKPTASIAAPLTDALGHLPKWVIAPEADGTISAVGIAPKTRGGLQFQLPRAKADGRANIAAQIETQVSRLTKEALRSARVGDTEEIETVFTQATKSVIKKLPLRGAKRTRMYQDPKDGTLYIQMSVDSAMVLRHFQETQKLYKLALGNSKLSSSKINKAEKAVAHLYKELDAELKK